MLSNTLDLLYNLAMLVALSVVSGFIRQRREHRVEGAVLQGLLFATAAVIGMMRPLVLGPGLIFDGRSVMISLCALFFGPLAVSLTGGMALLYRMFLGGTGLLMGCLVIVSAALWGLLFHHRWVRRGELLTVGRLVGLGWLVHGTMVLLMFTLPAGTSLKVIERVGLPVLLAYPLVTLLIGKVLSGQESALRSLEALRQSEEKFRDMVATLPLAIHLTEGIEQVTKYINPTMVKLFGYTPEDIPTIAEWWPRAYPDETYRRQISEEWTRRVKVALETQTPIEPMEVVVTCKDGSKKDVSWGYITLGDQNYSCGLDLTERKRAEVDLKRSEEALKRQNGVLSALLNSLPIGVFMVEAPSGKPMVANEVAQELLGRGVLPNVSSENLSEVYSSQKQGSRKPYPLDEMPIIRGLRGESSHVEDMMVERPDGTQSLLEVFGSPVVDDQGQVWASLVSFLDITERKKAEEARRESNELLSLFVHHSPIYAYIKEVTSTQSRVVQASENFQQMIGIPGSSMAGKTMAELFPPDLAKKFIVDDWAVVSEGKVLELEEELDGRSYSTLKFPIRQGGKTLLAGFSIDITERKKAGEALRENEKKYRTLVDNLSSGMVVHAPDTSILFSNAMASSLLGLTEDQMRGKTAMDPGWWFLREDLSPMPLGEYPVNRVVASEEGFQGQVLGVNRPDRTEPTWVLCNAYPVKNEKGQLLQTVVTFTDITERKQAEEALRHSEQKFRTIFENLAEGVALHELVPDEAGNLQDYRIVDVNPAFERHTGVAAITAVGRLGTELYGTETPPYLEEYSKVALGGAPYAFETFFPPLEKHFRISVISPKAGQFATVFEDITDRKRREEELKQKNAEMERFTYMISHDLKSPLVTVRTFLGYLDQDLEQGRADRVAKDMGFIREATGKMGRLLEDLLEVSRVGRVLNPPVRVSLADLIQESLVAVAGAISTQGVAIQVHAPTLTLFGDRPRLEEIWQNLVENAVKYMGTQPSPRIDLGVEGRGTESVFYVRDNGMGIDPRFQGKVFELFEKLDPASEGTGLGLALVRRIVEVYEGRIWLESEGLGNGTCFRFTLPGALKNRTKESRS